MSLGKNIADIRQQYMKGFLDETHVADAPLNQFESWFGEALKAEVPEPNAMGLATVVNGRPSLRIVLLKGFDEHGFTFFTNYDSRKGTELAENPYAALTFYWSELERQVRLEGTVTRISEAESEAYYQSRDRGSRIGAWASQQSHPIVDRAELETKIAEIEARYQGKETFPRPPHWGGYKVQPFYYEFWQGRPSRLHDRITYKMQESGIWKIERLAP